MTALPACLQPRLGLQVFGTIPPGCFGYLVDDDDSDPVLRAGEFAVIDTAALEPEAGALFLIEWNTGERALVEAYVRGPGWWVASYNRPRDRIELQRALKRGASLTTSDGPYEAAHLSEKLIGKVVGVLAPDRHSRQELMRRRDVRRCPPHILATGYGAKPGGYIEPAGSRGADSQ